jgi:hypothetical protein
LHPGVVRDIDMGDVEELPNSQRGSKAGEYLATPSSCGYIPSFTTRYLLSIKILVPCNRVLMQLPRARRDAIRYPRLGHGNEYQNTSIPWPLTVPT